MMLYIRERVQIIPLPCDNDSRPKVYERSEVVMQAQDKPSYLTSHQVRRLKLVESIF